MDFIKHTEENNKNLASLNEIEERLKSQRPKYKNYQRAKAHGSKNQTDTNSAVEFFYHSLVEKVKELYAKLPNREDRVIILLDLKQDPVNLSGIHCLVTPSFFVHLECDYYNNYKVEYQFYRCPFEGQVQELINRLSLRSFSTQIATQPEYPAFFKRCLRVNPERFIYLL